MLNKRNAKWVEYLEQCPYVIKYKNGKTNVVADALSRRHTLFCSLGAQTLWKCMLQMNISLPFMRVMGKRPKMDSIWLTGICSKKESFAYSKGSIRKLLVKESHEGGLLGHFWIDKNLVLLKEKFYWPLSYPNFIRGHWRSACKLCVDSLEVKISFVA